MYNSPNIGIYAKVNDDFVFIPDGFSGIKSKKLSKSLQANILFTSVANTRLLGILMVVNNHVILVGRWWSEDEIEMLKKKTDLFVVVLVV